MPLDDFLSLIPSEVRQSPWVQALVLLLQTKEEELNRLRGIIQVQQEELARANAKIKALEDELAKFRKTPKKPIFRPNGMQARERSDKKDFSALPESSSDFRAHREVLEVKVAVDNVPKGARFKGYQTFAVQDLVLKAQEITYKLEVWQTQEGKILRAQLPKSVQDGHFGPTLRATVTNLYAEGVTQPSLHKFLSSLGVEISVGQVNNLLLDEAQGYSKVSEEVLTAGLQHAPYVRVDDTGEKHQHRNGYCTHIGGRYFAYYRTTFSKSRENFLKILLQGKEGYVINSAMILHLSQSGVDDSVLNDLEAYQGTQYKGKKGLNRLLNSLGIVGKKVRKQCIEAGLVGFISERILRKDSIMLSDRAGQFAILNHAACWVHMERPLRKIPVSSQQIEKELKEVRSAIWHLYERLKKASIEQTGKEEIQKLYDKLIAMKTSSPQINQVISNFASYRPELLKALNFPGLPLHNNDSERDIRPVAKRRNLSGSTKSERGRAFRDSLLTIKQTCFRLGISFWHYLKTWFHHDPPDLAKMVRLHYQAQAI